MKQHYLLFFSLLCLVLTTQAQHRKSFGKIPLTKTTKAKKNASSPTSLFTDLKAKSGTDFKKTKSRKDKLGIDHTTYQQYHKGIKVEYGKLKVHAKTGEDSSYNGEFYNVSEVNTSPRLSERAAFERTKQRIPADTYAWEETNNLLMTERPKGELVIYPHLDTEKIHLAYKFDVFVVKPKLVRGFAYIDAHTGEFLFFNPKLRHTKHATKDVHPKPKDWVKPVKTKTALAEIATTGDTRFSGSQSINTYDNNGSHILMDDSKANGNFLLWDILRRGIITMNMNNDTSTANAVDFTDVDNIWTSAEYDNADMDNAALDVHWGMGVVYDYWNDTHGWKSYDNNDSFLLSFIHYGNTYINAGWTGTYMIYGDGGTQGTADIDPVVSLDITAHEVAHGINDNTADLVYQRESGAMDEGFADIWAMVIDNYANTNRGTSKDINLIGEEVVNYYNGWPALRSMSNPNQMNQPDTYMGTYWEDVSDSCTPDKDGNDYCGVHTNSGVLNHWFYLLSTGGNGTNDIGSNFTVSAIGIDAAASIAFRMQSEYLTSNSGFAEARDASIQSAIDLFGGCSTQLEATTNAFYAVGVGAAYVAPVDAVVTTNPTDIDQCVGTNVIFTITATDAATYQWQENDGNSWSAITNDTTYAGATTATLTITDITFALNSYQYRCVVANTCGAEINSTTATLTADEFPIATAAVSAEACGGDIGEITFTFPENPIRGEIEFSIDGGTTYPHKFNGDIASATVTNLAAGSYDVWVRWSNEECPLDIENITIKTITPPNATVVAVDGELGSNNGKLQLAFTDDANQGYIEFSIDNGVTYPYIYKDTSQDFEISNLAAGDYQVWTRWDDASCPTDLGTYTISEIAYTAIPDTNFEDALNTQGYDDIAGDGRVPTNLISGLTFLNVGNKSINDLTGIEDFTALLGLFCHENNLDELDISANTVLESLHCHENSLDELDVSTNTALKNLRAYGNQLEDLDLSTNVNLEYLYTSGNNIANLDLKFNTALKIVAVENSGLESLNVDTCSVLEILNASGNNLTSLSLANGNNAIITEFKAQNNPNLECINVDDETAAYLISNIWIKDDTASYGIHCYETYVPDDIFEAYLETHNASGGLVAVGNETSMGNGIEGDDYVTTANIENVTTLNAEGINIKEATGIESFTSIVNLNLDGNQIATIDLSANSTLVVLRMESNTLDNIDLTNNPLLAELYLSDNGLPGVIDLSSNIALLKLDVEFNALTGLNIDNNVLLEDLEAGYNQLKSIITTYNPNLTSIDVRRNELTTIDLSLNPLLNYVQIGSNQLTSANLKNGANANLTYKEFGSGDNPNLTCMEVDNVAHSIEKWIYIDDATSFNLYCSETYVPDNIFEAYLETHDANGIEVEIGADNSMGNGILDDNYVPTPNIASVTSLIVSNLGVTDITGIEYFTAIETFYCDNNQIPTLDISANVALTSFRCNNNLLTTLDLSANVALTSIRCNNNQIATLDLSANPNLRVLRTFNNLLTSIDVSQNIALEQFRCGNSLLTSLDLSQNIALKKFSCEHNVITHLDVSQNIALEELTCNDNNLTSLDLSQNIALEEFICDDNNLTSLDVSSCVVLETLLVDDNELIQLNVANGNNGAITGFNTTGNENLSCIQVDNVTDAIRDWTEIDDTTSFSVNCSRTYVPDDIFEAYLETHDTDGNEVEIGANNSMGNGIADDDYVTTANIENVISLEMIAAISFLDPDPATLIADMTGLEDFTALEALNIANQNVSTLDTSANTKLTTLYAGGNGMTTLNISSNLNLELLNLQNNELTTIDVSTNTNLDHITIGSNLIATLDVSTNIALTYLSCTDMNLITLDLSNNPELELFTANKNALTAIDLSANTKLKIVYLSDNALTNLDLSANTALTFLYAYNNELTSLNLKNTNYSILGTMKADGNPNLTCIEVDDPETAAIKWKDDIDNHTNFSTDCGSISVSPKVFLQGAMLNPNNGEENWMRDDLRVAGLVSMSSPYDPDGISAAILDVTGANAIVDWVLVEFRDPTNNSIIITSRGALIQRDGDIVTTDGVSPLRLSIDAGNYYIAIKHRNHLGIMTATTISLSNTTATIDFTDGSAATYGSNAQTTFGMPSGVSAMWAGNVNGDSMVQYSGTNPDTPNILSTVLDDSLNILNFSTYELTGYHADDVNMDGNTQYSGTNPDTPFILQNVMAHPGNALNFNTYKIIEQLPENLNP